MEVHTKQELMKVIGFDVKERKMREEKLNCGDIMA